jgi:hypothetical protein
MAGMGTAGLVATGAAAGVAGFGLAIGEVYSFGMSGGAAAAGGATAAAGALMVAAPVMGVIGIVRAVHNSQVNKEIELRQTPLPAVVLTGQTRSLDVFFPLAPSPGHIEISYVDARGAQQLNIDTSKALAGLHLAAAATAPPEAPTGH